MPHLCDTNMLLRFVNVNDREHELVRDAVRVLLLRGETLYYTQQNRREFWNVCTRPVARNGLGYTVVQAQRLVAELDAGFQRLPDVPQSGPIWDRLVFQYAVTGVAVHDAQLVASMIAHGIPTILALTDADFQRFANEIVVVHPAQIPPLPELPA